MKKSNREVVSPSQYYVHASKYDRKIERKCAE